MSRTYKDSPERRQARTRGGRTRPRHIAVRGVRRDPPDLRKLSRALIALVLAEAEEEAEVAASHATDTPTTSQPADHGSATAESSDEESSDGR
jgi:hypothetical protein